MSNEILNDIRNINVPILPPRFQVARYTQQEAVKAQLYNIGRKYNFLPIFELRQDIQTPHSKRPTRAGRIDIAFCTESNIIWAFEIDHTPKQTAVAKLKAVDALYKFIIIINDTEGISLNKIS